MTLQIHYKKPAQPAAASLTSCYDQGYLHLQPHYTSTPLTFTTQAVARSKEVFVQIRKRHSFLKTLDVYLMEKFETF